MKDEAIKLAEKELKAKEVFRQEDAEKFYDMLGHGPYGCTEGCALYPDKTIYIGFFDNKEAFIKECKKHVGKANIYLGLNPRNKELMKLASNELKLLNHRANYKDIPFILWQLLDVDPKRPEPFKKASATAEEKAKAFQIANKISSDLIEKFYRSPFIQDSGNGYHLLLAYPPINLNGQVEQIKARLRAFEGAIRKKYQNESVEIGAVHDLPRIIKVSGTLAMKGESTSERPHRIAKPIGNIERKEDKRLWKQISSMGGEKQPTLKKVTLSDSRTEPPDLSTLGISAKIKQLIIEGDKDNTYPSRSEADEAVITALKRVDCHNDTIKAIFANPKWRIGEKYREKGDPYLEHSIANAESFINAQTVQVADDPLASEPQPEPAEKTPIDRASFVQLDDGKIAELCFDPTKTPPTFFAIWDGESVEYKDSVLSEGKEIKPYSDPLIQQRVILLPEKAEPYKNEVALLSEVEKFVHRYVEIDPFFQKIASYYVLLTWIYDAFTVVPYLRALGDWGTGKSRFVQAVGVPCYKPIFGGGAITSSPVFRLIEKYHGTLIIDEADFRQSDAWVDIVKILNCGYQKGFPVLRTEKIGNRFEPRAYDCFGPKLLASRSRFKDQALESRMLTVKMAKLERHDVQLDLPSSFWDEATNLRNKLLMWRFNNLNKERVRPEINRSIEPRLNQIIIPIASIIDDKSAREELNGFISDYNQELIVDRGMTLEAEVLEALFDLVADRKANPSGGEPVTVKEVADKVDDPKQDKSLNPRRCGHIIREKLGLQTKKSRRGFYVVIDDEKLGKLRGKYGI